MFTRRLLISSLALMLMAGCVLPFPGTSITASGQSVRLEEDITGFSKVDAGSAFEIDIVQAENYSVVLTVDRSYEQYLDVRKVDDTLYLGLKPRISLNLRGGKLYAEVGMPVLAELDLSGAARGAIDGFTAERDLQIDLSGASRLTGELRADELTVDASGASNLTLTGTGQTLRLDASGASRINLFDLQVTDADVSLSGASRAELAVSGRLNVDASGASRLTYQGDPTIGRVNTSGGSSISPR